MEETHTEAYWRRKYGVRKSNKITKSQFERRMKFRKAKKIVGRAANVAGRFSQGTERFAGVSRRRKNSRGMFSW